MSNSRRVASDSHPSIVIGSLGKCLIAALMLGCWAREGAAFQEPATEKAPPTETKRSAASRYQFRRDHDPNGIGKFYFGREIAHVMGSAAAIWLERPEREDEEAPSKLIAALKLQPGQVVADIGAGSGVLTTLMAAQVGEKGKAIAVDVQQEMLDLLAKKLKQQKITNIELVLGTEKSPRLPANSVDLAIMVDVYHEFAYPYEMMSEIAKSLKPGGRVVFVEYRKEDPDVPIKLVHKMTQKQVKQEIGQPEFGLKWKETIGTLPRQHIIIFEKPEGEDDLGAAAPQWIWSPENAQAAAPIGDCWFRLAFELGQPESGTVEVTADNKYQLYVNGRITGSGLEWNSLDRYDIKEHLVKGRNVIAILAHNSDGPGGMVARVTVKAQESAAATYLTGPSWKTSLKGAPTWRAADFDDSSWRAAHSFGPLGSTPPWGDQVKPMATPQPPQFTAKPRPSGGFQLLDGDRVIFLGDTLIERAQSDDYLETFLTSRYPDRQIIFRNLGWSGDTVFGEARAGFGTVADGFRQLKDQVHGLAPTVIFVGYGVNESYAGEAGLPHFRDGLGVLLDVLEATKAQIVLLAPIRHENLGPPLPNPEKQNRNLELYRAAIEQTARSRGHLFLDLFGQLGRPTKTELDVPLTDNGIHLTPYGYWRAALTVERELGLPDPRWLVEVSGKGERKTVVGAELTDLKAGGKGLRFTLTDARLSWPVPPEHSHGGRVLRVADLPAGTRTLRIDGKAVVTATAEEWAAGVRILAGPEFEQAEKLRRTIIAKNQLYFYRWRPQNETYLFGFRKHEQGQNGREIPQFDPLVAEQEAAIAKLRVPVSHTYEIVEGGK